MPEQQSVLFSAEWQSDWIATDQPTFGASMTLNGVYSFSGDVNDQGRRAYAHRPVEPAFLPSPETLERRGRVPVNTGLGCPSVLRNADNQTNQGAGHVKGRQAWYQWAFSLPVTSNPLFDTADASAGQTGHVWFQGGNFTGDIENRSATIPAGVALFFPILNTSFDNTGWDDSACPPTSFTEAQLLALVAANLSPATALSCTIDGI